MSGLPVGKLIFNAILLAVAVWIFFSDRCLLASSGVAIDGGIAFMLALQAAGLVVVGVLANRRNPTFTEFVLGLPGRRLRASALAVPVYLLLSPWALWLVLDGARKPADPPVRSAEAAWLNAASCCMNPLAWKIAARR